MMTIPKKIYQAWHDKKVNPNIQKYIDKMLEMNPEYEYELFGEDEMEKFIATSYNSDVYNCYKLLNLITAKVDFWRYLILYKHGGIYLDIDSTFLRPLNELIKPTDDAIITREPNTPFEYVQWALIYCKEHPILEKTIENVMINIKTNK